MPQESELLKAVLEKPNDDAPRLAYAEWCDRADAPRAEFIRAQIDLVRLGRTGDQSVRNDLAYRQEKLAKSHRSAWAKSIAPFVKDYEFDRGFVELVTISVSDFLARAPVLFASAPIRHLNLTDVPPVARELFSSPYLSPIVSLLMDNCGLVDSHIEMLAGSSTTTSLKWLSLADNKLGFEAARALAASPKTRQLVFVNLHGNPVNPIAQFGLDDAQVVGEWLPPEGKMLESWYGPVPWLHRTAQVVWDLVPDRFRLA